MPLPVSTTVICRVLPERCTVRDGGSLSASSPAVATSWSSQTVPAVAVAVSEAVMATPARAVAPSGISAVIYCQPVKLSCVSHRDVVWLPSEKRREMLLPEPSPRIHRPTWSASWGRLAIREAVTCRWAPAAAVTWVRS